jgi:HAD superfamily hydrolase (TIGR01509 family)
VRPHWRSNLTRFDAVIFDMDGVLVDGEPLHFEAVNQLLAEEGRSISLDDYRPYMGTKSGWRELIRDFGLSGDVARYQERYLPLLVEAYRQRSVALPGAVDLVNALKGRIPLVVCSSSILPWVEAALAKIGLLDAFDHIVSGSDVRLGKPAPDIYLVAAGRAGVPPSRCLAIEDAPAGIESASAAGMTCWAIRTEYTRDLPLPPCEREFDSLVDVRLEDVLGVAV